MQVILRSQKKNQAICIEKANFNILKNMKSNGKKQDK